MADITIERLSDGQRFRGSSDQGVPDGYRMVEGNLTPQPVTTDSSGLGQSLYDILAPIHSGMQSVGQGYRENIAKPLTGLVRQGLGALPFDQGPGTQQALDAGAEFLVPQSTTSLGIMAGGLASGGMGFLPAVMGGMAGGLIGGSFEDRPLTGAAVGAGSAALGEGVRYGTDVIRRHFQQQGVDESRIADTFGSLSPALQGDGTGPGLARQVGTRAQKDLSAALEAGLQDINTQLGGGATFSSRAIAEAFPSAPAQMTFLDAVRYIKMLGAGGWSPTSGNVTGGMGGMAARDLRAEAIEEIAALLPSNLADAWSRLNGAYAKGKVGLDLLQEPNVLFSSKPGTPTKGAINVPALQAKASQYFVEGDLTKRLGPAELTNLESGVMRGGSFGLATDRTRGIMPRAYLGGIGTEVFRIPLPTKYVGNPITTPSWPFIGAAGNLLDEAARGRNPYQR